MAMLSIYRNLLPFEDYSLTGNGRSEFSNIHNFVSERYALIASKILQTGQIFSKVATWV